MSRVAPQTPPTAGLSTAVTDTATTWTFPLGTYEALDRPEQIHANGEIVGLLTRTVGADEVFTVARAQAGTTAIPHDAGETVERYYPIAEFSYAPDAILVTATGGTFTYTPDFRTKYHFITVGGSTKLTVAAPSNPMGDPINPGRELRFIITITSTALSTQPAFHAAYWRSPTFTASLTANSASSVSFAYRGGGINTTNAWVRIN